MRACKFAGFALSGLGLWFNACGALGAPAEAAKQETPAPSAVAPSREAPPTVGATSESTAAPVNTVSREELELLKQQNSDLKGFQSDLLLTVWSTLAAVFVLTAALVGFGWFANFKMYERDKELLRRDLGSVVASSEERLQKAQESSLTNHEARIARNLDALEWEIKILDAEMQLKTGSPNVCVTLGLQALEMAIDTKTEWRIKTSLSQLEEAIDAGGEFYDREVVEAFGLLARVPAALSAQAEALAPKIKAAKIVPKSSSAL